MAYDEQFAADVLVRLCQGTSKHIVILGAGSNTQLALHRLGPAGRDNLRAILDDDPKRWGEHICDLPVQMPADYPLSEVDCVVITSETYDVELTRRSRELFGPDVPIEYTFERRQSLVGRINALRQELQAPRSAQRDPDPLWQVMDRLYTTLRTRLRDTPTWRYGPQRQIAEFQYLNEQLGPFTRWQDCRFFNFGCGPYHPLGIALLAWLRGAEQTMSTDVQPMLDEARSADATADLIAEVVLSPQTALGETPPPRAEIIQRIEAAFDLPRLRSGELTASIHTPAFGYRIESVYDCSLPENAYDLMVSRSVFEHLPDVPLALNKLTAVLQAGSVIFLMIDFADHRVYQDPKRYHHFSHLLEQSAPTYQGTNRLRFPDYPPMFEQAGLRIERYAPLRIEPVPPEVKAKLPDRYRAMTDDDLAVRSAVAILHKPT